MSNNSYSPISNTLNFLLSFKPTSAFPLDARSMFGSFKDAAAAALTAENAGSTNTIYYIGQRLTVFENCVVSTYLIQPDKTLKAIGAEVIGDKKSIVIDEETGAIGLKSFGVSYYAYHGTDNILPPGDYTYPDNMPNGVDNAYVKVNNVWYVYTEEAWTAAESDPVTAAYYELTEGWKDGLEPKVIQSSDGSGFELAWYEPSTTTVEGLSSSIGVLQTNFDNLSKTVNNNKTESDGALAAETKRATDAETALGSRISKNEEDIALLNGDSSTEGSVKHTVAAAIAAIMDNPDETMNSIAELVDWVNNHAEDALELNNNVTANTTAIRAIESLLGTKLPSGVTATNVIDYIAEAVAAETTRATERENGLDNRLGSVEITVNDLKGAAFEDKSAFATAAQGAKADTAVQKVVSSENNGSIKVDGAEVPVYNLPNADVTTLGGVKPDGSSVTTDSNGVLSVNKINSSKIEDFNTQATNIKNNAVTEAKEYINNNTVLTTDITTSENLPESVEAASDGKVISEKVFLAALTWIEGM